MAPSDRTITSHRGGERGGGGREGAERQNDHEPQQGEDEGPGPDDVRVLEEEGRGAGREAGSDELDDVARPQVHAGATALLVERAGRDAEERHEAGEDAERVAQPVAELAREDQDNAEKPECQPEPLAARPTLPRDPRR